jgi:hypothetical protein
MIDLVLAFVVLGALALAISVDVAVLINSLRRRGGAP